MVIKIFYPENCFEIIPLHKGKDYKVFWKRKLVANAENFKLALKKITELIKD